MIHKYVHMYIHRYLCTEALIRMRVLADLAIFHVLKQHNTDQEPAAKKQIGHMTCSVEVLGSRV
jgi:hypothetical protein